MLHVHVGWLGWWECHRAAFRGCAPAANTIDSLADAVADFLMKPQDSGREVPPSKSEGRASLQLEGTSPQGGGSSSDALAEKLAKVRASKQAKKERCVHPCHHK